MTTTMVPAATVQSLLALADLDDRDAAGQSVSVRLYAVLSDGRQVVLLDDRGWSSGAPIADRTAAEVKRTAAFVVGPDAPGPNETEAEMEESYWEYLARKLAKAGVETTAAKLKGLSLEVVLSDRLRRHIGEDGIP